MSTRTCPVCRRRAATDGYAHFCSKRCADVDLQRWFSGAYAVPGEEAEGPEALPPEAGRDPDDLL